jgi:hypothetical protein
VATGGASGEPSGRACVLRLRKGKPRCSLGLVVLGLGATRAGSVAWITADGVYPTEDPICCAVYKRDAGSEDAVKLDSGADIDRSSFAVGGRHIYWTKAGTPQSATMP